MKILIVGAGIGGLALAELLKRQGHEILVIEKEKKPKNLGYVLGIWSNGMRVLEELGISETVRKKGLRVPNFILRDGKGKLLLKVDFDILGKNGEVVEIEREVIYEELLKLNKNTKIRKGLSIKKVEEKEEKARVIFTDDTQGDFDMVVGADGINSTVRKIIQPGVKKDYSGHTFFLFWVPSKLNSSKDVQHFWGNGKFFGLFPTKNSRHSAAYFSIPTKRHSIDSSLSATYLRENFSDMGETVQKILKNLPKDPARIYHTDDNEIHDRVWYKGRVALLGDSVHALSSIPAMGACMALEDAYVLADEISKGENVGRILEDYQGRRIKRIKWLSKKSRQLHFAISIRSPFHAARNSIAKNLFIPLYFKETKHFLEKKV